MTPKRCVEECETGPYTHWEIVSNITHRGAVLSKNQRWASDDDANDLLAGILDETEQDAKAEEQRIQAEIQAREEAERRKREAEEERKRLEAEARISAEVERQNTVQERRTARMEALKIEDLKARGEWVDPAILAKKQAEELAKQREVNDEQIRQSAVAAAAVSAASANAPLPVAKASNAKLFAAVGILAILVMGAGGVLFAMSKGYEPDPAQYTKTLYKPKDVAIALVEKGSTPIPKVEEPTSDEEPLAKTSRRSNRRSTSSVKRSTAKAKPSPKTDKVGKAANRKADALEKILNSSGSDPFGQ